ncbi:unnamed protein product [Cuscuta epithymum]|uniref:Uncharacterized protein n=2 Tax=Cuscuta epithymum TaxID=186058 RepID=A0AAV0CI31_9ASTE|nr:unnamed protein product [Cuscuta epithymum]
MPMKNRIREIGEIPMTGKLTKRGTTITCQLCFKKGHNKKGCPSKEQILQGTTTFPFDLQGGNSQQPQAGPEESTQDGNQESNSTFGPPNENNVPGSRLQHYFTENTNMEVRNSDNVFQFRGENAISADGLERLRQRKGKEISERASKGRKRIAEEVELNGVSTTARDRFHTLFDSMEDECED